MSEIELFDEEDNADLMDIAQLVEENANMRRKIDKVTEYIKKQYYKKIFDGEYVINADDLLSILESKGGNNE